MLYTLDGPHSHQEEVKKSRFAALAAPVRTPQEALQFFERHADQAATHNCWAYRIGQAYRFNDDGEPGGTAGRPILQAIEGQQCDRVAVLVVRWFGGVKLGAGGLVRAYGGVAAQCLRLAAKTPLLDEVELECGCAFADMALVQSRFAAFQAQAVSENFGAQGVRWRLRLPREQADAFARQFADLTRGGLVRVLDAEGRQTDGGCGAGN